MEAVLPFSQACENNKQPILAVLQKHVANQFNLLEIGGGTGQHAVYFAEHYPAVRWQSSDIADNVEDLNQRLQTVALPNLPEAITLDVNDMPWPVAGYDMIFSANSLHIMSSDSVVNFFKGVGSHLNSSGLLFIYGPFRYQNEFTTESNARFDVWLKQQNPDSGIRDFEWIDGLAGEQGLELIEDNAMPANNQLLVWQRTT